MCILYSTSHHSPLIILVHQMKYLDLASAPPHLLQLRTKKRMFTRGAAVGLPESALLQCRQCMQGKQ